MMTRKLRKDGTIKGLLAKVNGKRLALLVYEMSKRWKVKDAAIFFGNARVEGSRLYFDHGKHPLSFDIPEDALERLKRVTGDLRDIFEDAKYFIWMTIGDLPEGEDVSQYIPTGLKWPTRKRKKKARRKEKGENGNG